MKWRRCTPSPRSCSPCAPQRRLQRSKRRNRPTNTRRRTHRSAYRRGAARAPCLRRSARAASHCSEAMSLLRRRAHQVPEERQEEVCKGQRRLGLLGANQELDEPYSRRRRAADSGGGGPAGVPGERLRAAGHRPGRGLPRDWRRAAGALPPRRRLRRAAGRPGVALRRGRVRRRVDGI